MTANYQFIIDTGTIVPDTSTILADVQSEYRAALGPNLDVSASTPQGTLIAAEAIARSSVMRNNADLANLLNPDLSYGVHLDAIASLLGIARGQNQSTIANGISIIGTPGTVVPAGSRVESSTGAVFSLSIGATIPPAGSVLVSLTSEGFGPIPLPTQELRIIDGTVGWGQALVTANTTVIPGTTALNDPQLKIARNQRLFNQGVGSSGAIQSAVLAVDNATSVNVVENNTGAVDTVNGVQFTLPNAMWVCVGGTASDQDIADALYAAHAGGCPWDYGTIGQGVRISPPNGVLVKDPYSKVSYYVKASRPNLFDVFVDITVQQNNSVSSPTPSIQNAILRYANGLEQGEPGLIVGADVSAFEMGGAVVRQLPGMYVKDCKVAVVPAGSAPPLPGDYTTEIQMLPYQQGVLLIGNITVHAT
ncbi:baseplate wedge subunit [Xanthomonas phage XcP1]|uniref:Uncharacterized protein n=1 Tax=Xanthomonas phage XcP1 TaxID=2785027 RepID=A0A3S7L8L8_9CAUD|nr:baseplate wedge subunit [Xanthomonas phage XcP1]AWN08530.1 hypothetical protein XcP1_028 [Xanthomonas phage XcP1]